MTKYTADDFKNARFASTPDGRIVMRATPNDTLGFQWVVVTEGPGDLDKYPRRMLDQYKDKDLASLGFEPVQESSRPLTAEDLTEDGVKRAQVAWLKHATSEGMPSPELVRLMFAAALTEPTRPEEKVEAVLNQYWSGDVDGTDLAALIVEEMNR